ncbi:MAG: nickel pincer cofactor biosynthesis protein LarC [Candidatus Margulisiibacteriota bacterium]|nr:nickel pincer cofactor biosynthesis protein LarC [Candidatus Margulisiibacteriota bacterium]
MKTAYFDCSSGIAGNMVLGALIDAGLDVNHLKKELCKLHVPHIKYHISRVKRSMITSTLFNVKLKHEHHHRNLNDILSVIKKSKLSKEIKYLSSRIFKRLARAEAKVHKVPLSKIHFHEVGAVDAIVDIVGSCIGLEWLGIEKAYASPIPHGKGTIKHAHGILPIPAPATAELLKGIPTYGTNIKGELVTPTGAAIITTIASDFIDAPRIKLERTGYGAGTKIYPKIPGTLRVFIGEAEIPSEKDAILQIEANIDDMDPKSYDRVIAKLMKAGALDAFITPIRMKKERDAVNLAILCAPELKDKVLNSLFTHTTTLGVRTFFVLREKLTRKIKKIKTKYGKAKIKIGLLGKELKTIAPEYEDYKRIAKKHHIPITKAYNAIQNPHPLNPPLHQRWRGGNPERSEGRG